MAHAFEDHRHGDTITRFDKRGNVVAVFKLVPVDSNDPAYKIMPDPWPQSKIIVKNALDLKK